MSSISFVFFGFALFLTSHLGDCGVLRETSSDEVEKRSLSRPSSDITLNFQHGMRDFVVNGKGVGIQGKTLVAFQATLTSGNIGPNYSLGAIRFNTVDLNTGNGYSASTGKFTAPIAGLYQFSASYLQRHGYSSHVKLMKGNTVFSELHANHKNYDQLSKTILVALAKGETFWVQLHRSSTYAVHGAGRYTQFGGFLLSPTK
ncbi:complement C1q tumor necrosis factor-related protein 3-like [Dendronephthya gigantea]|uniref:complement C1q tumor necrosis factor-related protein 3-like n=1 Tax=Dendronephthya gigantea TaxID=151771 RepID=UPI00106D605C|nr:complement C1q tumor necrosis factor-related protein 3-like [Dendronephthya gigantea]